MQERSQATDLDPEVTEMEELVDKDFKILIKNRPTYLNKNLNTVKRETELKKGWTAWNTGMYYLKGKFTGGITGLALQKITEYEEKAF